MLYPKPPKSFPNQLEAPPLELPELSFALALDPCLDPDILRLDDGSKSAAAQPSTLILPRLALALEAGLEAAMDWRSGA